MLATLPRKTRLVEHTNDLAAASSLHPYMLIKSPHRRQTSLALVSDN